MSETPTFYATVKDGQLVFDRRVDMKRWLVSCEGKRVQVIVRPRDETRTEAQGKYFHGVVLKYIMNEFGDDIRDKHDKDRIKQYLLKECYGTTPYPHLGIEVLNEPSTAGLGVKKFAEFTDWCLRWAMTKHGIYIPGPNEPPMVE